MKCWYFVYFNLFFVHILLIIMNNDREPKLLFPVYARGKNTFPDHWVGAKDGIIVQNHELTQAESDGYIPCLNRKQRKQILSELAEQKRQESIQVARDRADERRIDNLRKLMGMVVENRDLFNDLTKAHLRPSDAMDPDKIPDIVGALHKSNIKEPEITDEGSILGKKRRTTTFIDSDSLPRPEGSIRIEKSASLSERTFKKLSTPVKKPLQPLLQPITKVLDLFRKKASGADIESEADVKRISPEKQQRLEAKAKRKEKEQLHEIQKAYLYGRGTRKRQAQQILSNLGYECFDENQIVERGEDSDHIICLGTDGNVMEIYRKKSAIEKRISGIAGKIIR